MTTSTNETVTFEINRLHVNVRVTLQVFESNGELICGLRSIDGKIGLPPKALRAAMIADLAVIEGIVRDAGCVEMRHAGDDRKWFLPGYGPMNDNRLRNGRSKRL